MNVDTLSHATTKMMFRSEIKKAVVSLNFRTTFRPRSLSIDYQQQGAGNGSKKGQQE
jgi:hypothetical protein